MALVFMALATKAQVVLDSTMAPAYGRLILSVYLDDPASFVFGKTGENLVWDFTGYPTSEIDSVLYEDPANTPYFSEFPDATLAIYQNEEGIGYIKNTAENYVLQGAAAAIDDSVYVITFDPPTVLFNFPYTYGNSLTDTTEFSITGSGTDFGFPAIDSVRYKASIITDRIVQAWGSLILPDAVFDETLLEKNVTTQIDSFWMKVPFFGWIPMGPPEISTDSSFLWLTDQVLHPYAELYYEEGEISAVKHYYDHTVSIPDRSRPVSLDVKIYPNPARGNLTVVYHSPNDALLVILDMSGREVMRQKYPANSSELTLDLGSLKPGFYNLAIRDGNNRANLRFIRLKE